MFTFLWSWQVCSCTFTRSEKTPAALDGGWGVAGGYDLAVALI